MNQPFLPTILNHLSDAELRALDTYDCDDCGKDVEFEFTVNPTIWNQVIHDIVDSRFDEAFEQESEYLCLGCFMKRAISKGIHNITIQDIVPVR